VNRGELALKIAKWVARLKWGDTTVVVDMNQFVGFLGGDPEEKVTDCICQKMVKPSTFCSFMCPLHGEVVFDTRHISVSVSNSADLRRFPQRGPK
jgi:hypothetical protein